MSLLHYRAGPGALAILRERGLTHDSLRVVVGTATGPRWLALVGLDTALMESGLLDGPGNLLFVGASAGAWRSLALASPDARQRHAALVDGYIGQSFSRMARPSEVSSAYRTLLEEVFPPSTLPEMLARPHRQIGLHICRGRGMMAARTRWLQLLSFVAAAGLTSIASKSSNLFLERVLLLSKGPGIDLLEGPRTVELTEGNLYESALASGTVPLYMRPTDPPPGTPPGRYIDGGMADYHLRERYQSSRKGITLLFHYQEELRPTWFDKHRAGRCPTAEALDPVLLVYADRHWIDQLPGGGLPDRQDFLDFAQRPRERQTRWHEAVNRSQELGKAWLGDLHSGRLVDLVRPLPS